MRDRILLWGFCLHPRQGWTRAESPAGPPPTAGGGLSEPQTCSFQGYSGFCGSIDHPHGSAGSCLPWDPWRASAVPWVGRGLWAVMGVCEGEGQPRGLRGTHPPCPGLWPSPLG